MIDAVTCQDNAIEDDVVSGQAKALSDAIALVDKLLVEWAHSASLKEELLDGNEVAATDTIGTQVHLHPEHCNATAEAFNRPSQSHSDQLAHHATLTGPSPGSADLKLAHDLLSVSHSKQPVSQVAQSQHPTQPGHEHGATTQQVADELASRTLTHAHQPAVVAQPPSQQQQQGNCTVIPGLSFCGCQREDCIKCAVWQYEARRAERALNTQSSQDTDLSSPSMGSLALPNIPTQLSTAGPARDAPGFSTQPLDLPVQLAAPAAAAAHAIVTTNQHVLTPAATTTGDTAGAHPLAASSAGMHGAVSISVGSLHSSTAAGGGFQALVQMPQAASPNCEISPQGWAGAAAAAGTVQHQQLPVLPPIACTAAAPAAAKHSPVAVPGQVRSQVGSQRAFLPLDGFDGSATAGSSYCSTPTTPEGATHHSFTCGAAVAGGNLNVGRLPGAVSEYKHDRVARKGLSMDEQPAAQVHTVHWRPVLNSSKAEHVRLGVRLIRADMNGVDGLSTLDPFAAVKCERTKHVSKAVTKCTDPNWDEFFAFEVKNTAFAVLKVKVMDHRTCWRPAMVGELRISVKTISEMPQRYSLPTWHELRSRKGRPSGQVQLQIYYVSDRVHRPLDILCGTWNVGNAQPPDGLDQWLSGVQEQEHDLVAIGVQECAYKLQKAGPADEDMAEPSEASLRGMRGTSGIDLGLARLQFAGASAAGRTDVSSRSGAGHSNRVGGGSGGLGALHRFGFAALSGGGSLGGSMPAGEDDCASSDCRSDGGSFSAAEASRSPYQPQPTGLRAERRDSMRAGAESPCAMSPSSPQRGRSRCASTGPCTGLSEASANSRFPVAHPKGAAAAAAGAAAAAAAAFHLGGSDAFETGLGRQFGSLRVRTRGQSLDAPRGSCSHPPRGTHGAPNTAAATAAAAAAAAAAASWELQDLPVQAPPARGGSRPVAEAQGHSNTGSFSGPLHSLHASALSGGAMTPQAPHSPALTGGTGGTGTPRPELTTSTTMRRGSAYYKSRGVTDLATGGQFRDEWEDHIKDAMGPNYSLVKSAHMGQIRLLLYARNDICAAISRVERGTQATGVAGVATNKGGVAIGVRIWDTELCFINAHMAAHQDKVAARNNNYRDIIKGIRMDPYQMDCLTGYHHVFWVGDFNYRLDYGQQATNPTESPVQADFDEIVSHINQGNYAELQKVDQLKKEMERRRAFLGFTEAPIEFPPTFKVERKDGLHYKNQRSPAWCDRVLYRGNLPGQQAKALDYYCAPNISSSDHKPVAAIYSVPTVWLRNDGAVDGTPNIHLEITKMYAEGLFVVRRRRNSATSNILPNPVIIIKGMCMEEPEHRTSVQRQTRNPLWNEHIDLRIKPALEQDLANYHLMVRIVDQQDSSVLVPGGGKQNSLARGIIPLAEAAALVQQGRTGSATVNVKLEYNGLRAGKLTVVMSFRMPEKKQPASMAAMGRLMKSSMSFALSHRDGTSAAAGRWASAGQAGLAGLREKVRRSMDFGHRSDANRRDSRESDQEDQRQQQRQQVHTQIQKKSPSGAMANFGRLVRQSMGAASPAVAALQQQPQQQPGDSPMTQQQLGDSPMTQHHAGSKLSRMGRVESAQHS